MIQNFSEHFQKNFSHQGPTWLKKMREEGMERFSTLGFPTPQWEEWKYTSLKSLQENSFELARPSSSPQNLKENLKNLFPHEQNQIVFVNGYYSPELSSLKGLPSGVIVASLSQVLEKEPARIEPYLTQIAKDKAHPLLALNTAFIQEGAFVYLPEGTILKEPVSLLFLSDAQKTPFVSHPRNLIVAEKNSGAKIVETYVGEGLEPYFTNAVTEIKLSEGAKIDHYKFQRESLEAFHLATLAVQQERSSHFTSHSFSWGARLARNDLSALLAAEGSECTLNGLYLGQGKQHIDHHTSIDHAMPRCTSHELYKGILSDQSQAVFNGRIVVQPLAAHTQAIQMNKNLLLSKDASINTKPLLEILNNDVKCNHGATIGQLDENQIFYLRSRGISDLKARHLLTYAFANDLLQKIRVDSLRTTLEKSFLTEWVKEENALELLGGLS